MTLNIHISNVNIRLNKVCTRKSDVVKKIKDRFSLMGYRKPLMLDMDDTIQSLVHI